MTLTDEIERGTIGGRLWFYSNYHCNLACSYCLTASAPGVARRELDRRDIESLARQAGDLGFTHLGVTGGEPFLLPEMPALARSMSELLPTVVLTNGTLFTGSRLAAVAVLGGADVALQISLDSAEPSRNDEARGDQNFAKVVQAIPVLVEMGIAVRIASTGELEPDELSELCSLHRSLGVSDDDHVSRPVVRRGRAADEGMGVAIGPEDLTPELTLTADGAYWSPFGPTVTGERLDTDLLLCRTTDPLRVPSEHLVRAVSGREPGADSTLNIR